MKCPLLMSLGIGPDYERMISDHEARHRSYCARWGYDRQIVSTLPQGYPHEVNWYKIDLIIDCLRAGKYSHIIFIDADAIIAEFDVDLCSALPDYAWLGLVVHPYAWKKTIWHWNIGVQYIRCCPEALHFFETVKSLAGSELDDRATYWEQGAVNYLFLNERRYQSGLVTLTHHWNVNIFNQPNEGAIVAAWHGSGPTNERAESMREWANNHPYPAGPMESISCTSGALQDQLTNDRKLTTTAIGIVIPVHNCLELTKAAVASIKTQHPFHLYFIDDHSNEETKNWLSSVPNATVFTDPERSTGLAWNWNLGISAAFNDGVTHVLIANNDIILHPDAIDAMVRRTDARDAVLVSGFALNCKKPEDVLSLDITDIDDGGNAQYPCFMITADTLKRVGWFDEHYCSAYCEDTDYRSTIYHFGEREVCTHAAQYYHYGSSTIKQDATLNNFVQDQANQNRGYFRSKWGCDPVDDVQEMNARYYPFPFNSQDRAVRKDEIPTARLAELYAAALQESSDIGEHLNILFRMASCVDRVTSITADGAALSTAAFVNAMPKCFITYCNLQTPEIIRLRSAAKIAGLDYIYEQYRSGIQIEPTDLLFIDTIKTEEVITRELNEYAGNVRKYMIFHDTETYGIVGELPGSRGIWAAITRFIRQHSEWRLFQHYSHCHGLTVLERRD